MFYTPIEKQEPLSLKSYLDLISLPNYTCTQIKENTAPVDTLKDPITGEDKLDKDGNPIRPFVLDTKNIDIVLWNSSAGGDSLDKIISTYGNLLVLHTAYHYDEYDNIEYLTITVQVK